MPNEARLLLVGQGEEECLPASAREGVDRLMSYKRVGLVWFGVCAAALVGCSADGSDAEGDVGSAEIAITQVPSDVLCVRIVAQGSRVRQQDFDVMPGQSSVLSLSGLPAGAVTFSGAAFPAACSQMSPPTYTADPVAALVQPPSIAQVALTMRRNGQASVSVDFETDAPTCVGTRCMSDAECCAGTSCLGDPTGLSSCQPNACLPAGGACMSSSECCTGLSCNNGRCDTTTCFPQGSMCGATSQCCAGLSCNNGRCDTAGTCGGDGATCDPASGTGCCTGFSCVTDAGGTAVCRSATMCGGAGASCDPASMTGCCAGLSCLTDAAGNAVCR